MPSRSKYINALKSGYSFVASSVLHSSVISGMPPTLGVELTNFCNLRCPECPTGSGTLKRGKGYITTVLFEKLVRELEPFLLNMNLYFQGEPMLHPGFFDLLDLSNQIHTTVSTNGHYLTEQNCLKIVRSGLGKLIISLDGIDQDSYSAYRINGDLEKVLTGIRNLTEIKKRIGSGLKIEIQFLVNKVNEDQVSEVRKLVKGWNATLRLKSMQINDMRSIDKWLPASSRHSRYENINGTFRIRNSYPSRCARLWLNPVITWDGKVVPCCFDKDAQHIMGDFTQQTFREIWHGEKFRSFRNEILSGRERIGICRNCTSGTKG